MGNDLSLYFENLAERQEIGTTIQKLMLGSGFNRSQAAHELHGQLGMSFSWTLEYLSNVFCGILYGTPSEVSIRRNPDLKRQRLAAVLSWMGVALGQEEKVNGLATAIKALDGGFQYPPGIQGTNGKLEEFAEHAMEQYRK